MSIQDMAIAALLLWLALALLTAACMAFNAVKDWWKGKNKGSK